MPQPAEDADIDVKPLANAIIALAELPDDMPGIDLRLRSILPLAADRAGAAYLTLRLRAAEIGIGLLTAASSVIVGEGYRQT
jgi:hypothetical protein